MHNFRVFFVAVCCTCAHGYLISNGIFGVAKGTEMSYKARHLAPIMKKNGHMVETHDTGISTRRNALLQAFAVLGASVAFPLDNANADVDFVPITEDIEGSDGTISKVGFAYPRNWKYERDVSRCLYSVAPEASNNRITAPSSLSRGR